MPLKTFVSRVTKGPIVGSAALGAFIAAMADSLVKQDASATKSIATFLWSDFHLGSEPQMAYAFALLVILAALVSVVFDAPNKKAAFAIGVGILSTILTVTPYEEKEAVPLLSLSAPKEAPPGGQSSTTLGWILGVGDAWAQPPASSGRAHLVVVWDSRGANECTITIHDLGRRSVVGRSRYGGRTDFLVALPEGNYRLMLESPRAQTAQVYFRLAPRETVELRAWMGQRSSIRQGA